MAAQTESRRVSLTEVGPSRGRGARAVPLANAATAVAVALYTICRIASVMALGLLVWFFQPWFHGIALQPSLAAIATFQPAEFVIGFVTFGGTVWLSAFAFARLYSVWSR